jgi:hypothetical protein
MCRVFLRGIAVGFSLGFSFLFWFSRRALAEMKVVESGLTKPPLTNGAVKLSSMFFLCFRQSSEMGLVVACTLALEVPSYDAKVSKGSIKPNSRGCPMPFLLLIVSQTSTAILQPHLAGKTCGNLWKINFSCRQSSTARHN